MLAPYLALRERGYDVSFVDKWNEPEMIAADVVIVQRLSNENTLNFTKAMQATRGALIVYELDDNLHTLPPWNVNAAKFGSGKPATKMVEAHIAAADAFVTSTPDLADEYRRFAVRGKTYVCENALTDDAFHQRFDAIRYMTGDTKRVGQVRIGYAGTNTHLGDIESVIKPIADVLKANREARMVFIGQDLRGLLPFSVRRQSEYAGAVHDQGPQNRGIIGTNREVVPRYYDLLAAAELDVAIAPLAPFTFNRCKSWLKVLEYGMLGIPVVASNFGPYRAYRSHARDHGVQTDPIALASSSAEWKSHLTVLVQSGHTREIMARSNGNVIAQHHLISRNVEKWEAMLADLGVVRPAAIVAN
jgi:glycosyltransferase involved in cell wall biosynthesis